MSELDSFSELVHGTYSMRSDAIEEYATLKAQRDELLAAAKVFRSSLYFDRNTEQVKRITMAAIANAEAPSCD